MRTFKLKALSVLIASAYVSAPQAQDYSIPAVDPKRNEVKSVQSSNDENSSQVLRNGSWTEVSNDELSDNNARQYTWQDDEFDGALRGAVYDNAELNQPPHDVLQEYHLPENSEYLLPADTKFVFWGLEPVKGEAIDMASTMFEGDSALEEIPNSSVETLRFESGESDITQTYQQVIQTLLDQLEGRRVARMRLIGHTDNQGMSAPTRAKYQDNVGLSIARAEEVALILQQELDLADAQISWGGEGEFKPIASNSTLVGMAQNRRVEVEIWFEKEAPAPQPRPVVTRALVCQSTPDCRYYVDPLLVADNDGFYEANEIPGSLLDAPEYIDAQCHIQDLGLDLDRTFSERYKLDLNIDPVYFASGSHQIKPEYVRYLRNIIDSLKAEHNITLRFAGHTDSDPLIHTKELYGTNQVLSEFRAREVREFLVPVLGIDIEDTAVAGYGFTRPAASNDVEGNKRKNRRVEVEIWAERKVTKTAYEITRVESLDQQATYTKDALGLSPFRITVDGQPVEPTERANMADNQRCIDVALEATEIQVVPDDLMLKPSLAVTASQNKIFKQLDQDSDKGLGQNQIEFFGYSNYLAYIESAEVRIFRSGDDLRDEPKVVLPLDQNLRSQWAYEPEVFNKPEDNPTLFDDDSDENAESLDQQPTELMYVLRTYGDKGRYDETQPQRIWVTREPLDQDSEDWDISENENVGVNAVSENAAAQTVAGGLSVYGENMLARQRIKIKGGTIRVNGKLVPEGHDVFVMGRTVPTDLNGSFASEQIVPEGYHNVEVAVLNEEGNGQLFQRELELRDEDWFYVGIADLTVGSRDVNGPASTVTQDTSYDDNSYAEGRLAFFIQGKTESGVSVVASADTREEPLEDLFSNFASKDPTQLFRRLDEDLFYPTFGDDSTLEELAPTQGKFYIRAEKNNDHILWGNFDASIGDSELTQINRGLYGLEVDYGSEQTIENGEERFQIQAFAAEPGTIGAREEFRGTGGSLYYLRHQDLTIGAENVYIEVRDPVTNRIIERERLSEGRDYDLDYLQGRILLESPLSSTSSDGSLINQGSLGGNENYLVVTYEYVPGFEELDDVALGGRASAYLTDSIQVGVTALDQEQLGAEYSVTGVDFTIDNNRGTYIKAEVAKSEGLAVNQLESINGGFGFSEIDQSADASIEADALRIEAGTQFKNGVRLSGYAQVREEGFSGAGQLTDTDTTDASISVLVPITKRLAVKVDADIRDEDVGTSETLIEGQLSYQLDAQWAIDLGVEFDRVENTDPLVTSFVDSGDRTDLGAAVTFDSLGDWSVYGFVQHTYSAGPNREENDRAGLGGSYQINDRFRTDAEISGGTTGLGAQLGVDYLATENTSVYFTLANDNQRSTTGIRTLNGNATAGFKTRYNERLNLYGEERYAYGDQPVGLTHAYGLDFAANEYWNFGGSIELGSLRNEDRSEIERLAATYLMGYSNDRVKYAGDIEYREDTTDTTERLTWLTRQSFSYQQTDDWRLLLGLDWSQSDSSQGEFFDGDFTEAVAGYAYRPVYNDRLNALVKYTYFFNKAAPEQVSTGNNNTDFIQRSHILSLDATYDLNERWSIGGKYAFKRGELALDRVDPTYFKSDTQLLVLRADMHIVNDWDLLIEGRVLDAISAEDRRSGFLAALYWHMNRNVKLGGGYNFTDFSDDLTDLSFDDEGFFINIIGKM